MTKDKAKVRQLLDAVRASGRTSLTAPDVLISAISLAV